MVPGYHHILTFRYVYKRSFQHLQAYRILYFQQYNIIFILNRALRFECMLPNAVIGYHNIQGSMNRHGTRVPPYYNLPIDIKKLSPTPPGTLHFILPTKQHHFVLNLATFESVIPNPVLGYHIIQGSIHNHGTRFSPHSNLTMDR